MRWMPGWCGPHVLPPPPLTDTHPGGAEHTQASIPACIAPKAGFIWRRIFFFFFSSDLDVDSELCGEIILLSRASLLCLATLNFSNEMHLSSVCCGAAYEIVCFAEDNYQNLLRLLPPLPSPMPVSYLLFIAQRAIDGLIISPRKGLKLA